MINFWHTARWGLQSWVIIGVIGGVEKLITCRRYRFKDLCKFVIFKYTNGVTNLGYWLCASHNSPCGRGGPFGVSLGVDVQFIYSFLGLYATALGLHLPEAICAGRAEEARARVLITD